MNNHWNSTNEQEILTIEEVEELEGKQAPGSLTVGPCTIVWGE